MCHLIHLCIIVVLYGVFSNSGEVTAKHSPKLCSCGSLNEQYNLNEDVVFVIDTTDVIEDIASLKQLVAYTVKQLTIGENYTQLGVINVGETVEVFASLHKYKNNEEALNDIKQMQPLRGYKFQADLGLEEAKKLFDAEETNKRRRSAKKVVVLITARHLDCTDILVKRKKRSLEDYACRIASSMRSDGITIITVPAKIKYGNLPKITLASPCFAINTNTNVTVQIKKLLCKANCGCEAPFIQVKDEEQCIFYNECIYPVFKKMNYTEAHNKCAALNSSLSDILSNEKDKFIDKIVMDNGLLPFWVGQRRNPNSNEYTWDINGETATDDYSNWINGEQNQINGECAVKISFDQGNTAWKAESCSVKNYFACQTP